MKKKLILFLFLLIALIVGGAWFYRPADRDNRILACISSFNRPIFVSGQVLRLLRQSYPVDISVSVKGVPSDFVNKALLSEWMPEIKSGRVRIRTDENRDQFSNFLDTVRAVDLDRYDYFCKVDDDDWYGPDYFRHINEWLKHHDPVALSYTENNMIVLPGKRGVSLSQNDTGLFGPSMCFSREVIRVALELEAHPEKTSTYLKDYVLADYRERREDNFLHKLSLAIGKAVDRRTPLWDLAFGWQYPSITRKW